MSTALNLSRWLAPLTEMLVRLADEDGFVSFEAVTEAVGMKYRYFERLRDCLVEDGLIIGARGPLGGCKLARDPYTISVGDIYRAGRRADMRQNSGQRYGWLDEAGHWPKSTRGHEILPTLKIAEDRIVAILDQITIGALVEEADVRRR